jgi:transcriptional regulator with XRE-family HTH domain
MKLTHGTELKAQRSALKLSQRELALKLGLASAQYISNVERGQCAIGRGHLKKLRGVLGDAGVERLIDAMLVDLRSQLLRLTK